MGGGRMRSGSWRPSPTRRPAKVTPAREGDAAAEAEWPLQEGLPLLLPSHPALSQGRFHGNQFSTETGLEFKVGASFNWVASPAAWFWGKLCRG